MSFPSCPQREKCLAKPFDGVLSFSRVPVCTTTSPSGQVHGGKPRAGQGYRFRSPRCVLFFSFSLRSCLASRSLSLCSLSCSFFLCDSSRSESCSSLRAWRTSSTLVFRNRAADVLRESSSGHTKSWLCLLILALLSPCAES